MDKGVEIGFLIYSAFFISSIPFKSLNSKSSNSLISLVSLISLISSIGLGEGISLRQKVLGDGEGEEDSLFRV